MSDATPITIRAIAAGGDGVGTLPDGRTVFVPRSAPGDTLTLQRVRRHARFARAEIATVVDAGPARTPPPCPHYLVDECGGCQLMHLDAMGQRGAKQRIVGDALRRIAKFDHDDPPVESPRATLGYRAKVTFAVRDGVVGFHRRGEAGRIFEVRRCLLLEPLLDELHQRLRGARQHLPRDTARVVLRRDAHGGRHVIVRTDGDAAWTGGPALAEALGGEVVVWWHPEGGAARAMAGSDDPWPAAVFEQVNPGVAVQVRDHAVRELLDDDWPADAVVWDLYAGIGEASRLLHERGVRVESVEIDPRAVALANQLGPAGPRRVVGDVAVAVGRLAAPTGVYTNPPRVGMDERVTGALAASGARRIVYVSCDPGTLARDLRRLEASYRLIGIRGFDQFPQTAHVECVATLERR